MKQLLCLLLAVILCGSLALTGCKAPANPTDPTATTTAKPTTAPTTVPTTAPTTTPTTTPTTNPTTTPTTTPTTQPTVPAALATAEQMKNVAAEKVSSAGGSVTAHPGGRITYKLHITNNNSVAVKLNITDTLPEGTSLVSGCDNASGSALSWEITVAAGETYTVTYNVKPEYTIAQVREAETDFIIKNTPAKVMDKEVSAPAKDIYVLETFNATDIRRIEMAIDALVTANLSAKNSSNKPMNGITLVSMMYSVGFTAGVGLGTTDMDEVLSMVFEKAGENAGGSTGGGEDVTDTATNLLKRVPPHLYGGTAIPADKDAQFRGSRAKEVTIQDLISGDLIFVNKAGKTSLYIVDGARLVFVGLEEVIHGIDPATVLPGLPASDKFVVIRPSINYNITFSLQEGEYFNDADKEGYTDLEKALIATAETYLLRGDRCQYTDDMTGTSLYRWESATKQPEDYTVDQYGYTNCAAFTYDVHWATYGYAAKAKNASGSSVTLNTTANLASSAARGWNPEALTGSNKSTIFYIEPPKTTVDGKTVSTLTDAEKEALKKQICSLLRPGDIICIRRTTGSGHAMLYVGNGMIIHSGGSNYSNTNKTDTHEATIRMRMVEDLFDPSIYAETSCVYNLTSFSIVRLQNLTTPVISTNTANRVANMQGIIGEKIASTAMGKTVSCGDTVTYTFQVFNTNKDARTVTIKDILSEHVTFVSATEGGSCSGNEVNWNITVPADTRISVSYTVKVKDGLAAFTAIDGSKATINGVVHKCIDTYVANTLTADQQQAIINAVETVKNMDRTGLTSIQVINLIYKTAFGVDNLFGDKVTTENELLCGDTDNSSSTKGEDNIGIFNDTWYWESSNKTSVSWMPNQNTSNAAQMVAPGMYGGQLVYNSSYNKNGRDERQNRYLNVGDKALRSRYFWEKDLVIGDIFMMRGSTTMYLYIYVGNDTFVILNGTSAFKTTSVSTRFQYAPSSTWKYLAVLRPSFVLDI